MSTFHHMLRSALCKNKNKTCSDFVAQLKLFHSFFLLLLHTKDKDLFSHSPTHLDTILSETLRLFFIIIIIIIIIILLWMLGFL